MPLAPLMPLTIKTPERRHWHHWSRSGVFIVNFEHISHLLLEFLLLPSSRVSIVNFEHANADSIGIEGINTLAMFYGQTATTVDTLVPKIVNGDVLRILYEEACKLFVWKDRLNFEVKQKTALPLVERKLSNEIMRSSLKSKQIKTCSFRKKHKVMMNR